jgi:hypothetical protein
VIAIPVPPRQYWRTRSEPAPAAPLRRRPDRAAREEKIAQDYASCMRARPKFECETARSAAIKALDAPPKAKSKSAAKVPAPAVATN